MKILIVGNGGREHALLWKLRQDAPDAEFFITLGNGGTAGLAAPLPFKPGELQALAGWAENQGVDLVVVGPEAPLAEGIVDHFGLRGIPHLRAHREGGGDRELQGVRQAAHGRHGIPTAAFHTFRELAAAEACIREAGAPVVVKASGLAAGKGAVVCDTVDEALAAAREMLGEGAFGEAGSEIVVEEFMRGEELSVFALADGATRAPHAPRAGPQARRRGGDRARTPAGWAPTPPFPSATPELMERVTREVLLPTVAAMAAEGRPFRGLLYAGLMLTADGPKVVEFNCRFGDPETQVVLPLLASSLLEPMLAIARGGSLAGTELRWRPGAAATTVLASGGYPGDHRDRAPGGDPPRAARGRRPAGLPRGDPGGGRRAPHLRRPRPRRHRARRPRSRRRPSGAAWPRSASPSRGAQFRRDIGWREARRGEADRA